MIRIFIGFDPRETVAWHVLCHSILARSSQPVSFVPLALHQLGGCFNRPRDPLQSTDFSFTRFLVPYLSGYEGWSLFMDCDMLVRADIAELWDLRDDRYAVMCVKHDHRPLETVKFLGAPQTAYGKKNWSSVMLFNNARCRSLTPDYVNTASGLELHQFKWVGGDDAIGELPHTWNHLVGHDALDPEAKNVHYTTGGPYFSQYSTVEFSEAWRLERSMLLYVRDAIVE
jgi:lipopolysaccharide biosynthesis glycosyltransferase